MKRSKEQLYKSIISGISKTLKKQLNESEETNDIILNETQCKELIDILIPQVIKFAESQDYQSYYKWDYDDEYRQEIFSLKVDDEIYDDFLDIKQFSNLISSLNVSITIEGSGEETYHRDQDYWSPEESSGEGKAEVYITSISFYDIDEEHFQEIISNDDEYIYAGSINLNW